MCRTILGNQRSFFVKPTYVLIGALFIFSGIVTSWALPAEINSQEKIDQNNKISISPTVTTDKEKYNPTETVYITASGFLPGESVEFQVLHVGKTPNTGNGHDPWTETDDASSSNIDGVIHTTWYVDPDDSFNSTFELTAIGQTSGLVASTRFTDDTPIPTAVSSSYDPVTDILSVTIDWLWLDPPNHQKAVSAAVFADLNDDGNAPGPDDNPSTWSASSMPGTLVPSDEFLGQMATSVIEGSTSTGDMTDTGIASQHFTANSMNSNTPRVLFPYGLNAQNSIGSTGTFTLTYSNVPAVPTSICVVLYDVHVNKKCDGTVFGTKYEVEDGELDSDMDGSFNNSDSAINFEGTGYDVINGRIDVEPDGDTDNDDDVLDNSFFGFDIIDGYIDFTNKDGITDKDKGCFATIGIIDDEDSKHSPISATATGGTPDFLDHNEDNSVEDGFGGTSVACNDVINSMPPVVSCPAENTGTIQISKN